MIKQMFTIAALATCMPGLLVAQGVMSEDVAQMEDVEIFTPSMNVDQTQEGFVPFKCPIEKIRIAYQNLVDPEDTLVALAIEKQTLAICRQSQEALIRIAENEARLNELFEPIISPPPPPEPEPVFVAPEPVELPAPVIEPVAPVAVAPVAPIAPIELIDPLEQADPLIAIEPLEIPEDIIIAEPVSTPPPYGLAAVMKDPLGWKAMLVDGDAIFTVREGQKMDDGSIVKSIVRGRVELLTKDNQSFFLE
jgi:hypothetical protein